MYVKPECNKLEPNMFDMFIYFLKFLLFMCRHCLQLMSQSEMNVNSLFCNSLLLLVCVLHHDACGLHLGSLLGPIFESRMDERSAEQLHKACVLLWRRPGLRVRLCRQ